MKDPTADIVKKIPKSGIRKYFDLASGIEDIISLGVGEPDFVTPWHIREAAIYSIEQGNTMYTSNYGLIELREELSKTIKKDYNVDYDPKKQILVTVGVSEALDLATRAILNRGDEVIVPDPTYVSYIPCIMLAGGVPISLPTSVKNDFKPTPEDIEKKITKKTKALLLGYPNNPTGTIMSRKELEEIADIVNEHDLMVISDEIYAKLTYKGKHTCFSSLKGMEDRTIYLNGFSKAYAMTGWRIGYACSTPEIIEAMMKIHQYTMMCASTAAQMGAIEALKRGEREMLEMIREYDRRRRVIVKRLNEIGLDCFEPGGAFYAFPSIKKTGLSSDEFSERLIKEQKVVAVSGDVFGKSGEGFIRCTYASSLEDINEAMNRVEKFVKKISKK